MPDRKPSKPWRVTYLRATIGYSSERAAYDAINELAANTGGADTGKKFTVEHWDRGQWGLYERGVFTENGWEPT